MSTQRIKIPVFDRDNYELWKRKMTLFLQVSNPKFLTVLRNGPIIPMVHEPEKMVGDVFVPARNYRKDPKDYTADERADSALDLNLQLILVESLDPIMYNHVVNCIDAKHIWDTIQTINEGTEEVRENRLEILTSEYEHFTSNPDEGISEVFERYNKLINNLNLHGKHYTQREINRKFLLTLPTHLEHRITAIRESRDMNEVSLERLYGVLKTYELEQIQQREVYGRGRIVSASSEISSSTGLIGQASQSVEPRVSQPSNPVNEGIIAEYGHTNNKTRAGDEFYSLEELEQLEDGSMAEMVKKFGQFRFRRNPNFKTKSTGNTKVQRGSSSTSDSSRGGYKTGLVDRKTVCCSICKEMGHFASECKKTYSSGKKSESAFRAKGRSWDDTDSDEEYANLALVADEDNSSFIQHQGIDESQSGYVQQGQWWYQAYDQY